MLGGGRVQAKLRSSSCRRASSAAKMARLSVSHRRTLHRQATTCQPRLDVMAREQPQTWYMRVLIPGPTRWCTYNSGLTTEVGCHWTHGQAHQVLEPCSDVPLQAMLLSEEFGLDEMLCAGLLDEAHREVKAPGCGLSDSPCCP